MQNRWWETGNERLRRRTKYALLTIAAVGLLLNLAAFIARVDFGARLIPLTAQGVVAFVSLLILLVLRWNWR